MSKLNYNLQFEKLFERLQQGKVTSVPEAVSGGLLHRMYAVETSQGKYAVKALNPQIILRPTARQNMINSERVASIAAGMVDKKADSFIKNKIPALPAKMINGNFLHEIDGQYYLVYDWINGRSLKENEIYINQCNIIGEILAKIHGTDFSEAGILNNWSDKEKLIEWDSFLRIGQHERAEWLQLFDENMGKINDWNIAANQAANILSSEMVISHRDLDPKNVMWNLDDPIIIDWEAAGYVNPMQELIETAVYWSENEAGNIDKEKFCAFIQGYMKQAGKRNMNWREALNSGFLEKLEWLEYNLKRSVGIECSDKQEQQLGTIQVTDTIKNMIAYAERIDTLESWLVEVTS